jgi:protein disulfide-isomerase A1
MRFFTSLIVAFCVLAAFVKATINVEEGVLVLNGDNWAEAHELHNEMLVEFYAPWCGHCKSLAPEWAKAAGTLADSHIKLAKVDATLDSAKPLAEQFEVRGFPTIKFFRNMKASDYQGGRTEKDIVAWVNKKSQPIYTTISSVEDIENFEEAHDIFVLGSFASADSDNAKAFISMAADNDDLSFAISTSANVAAHVGASGDSITVKNSGEDEAVAHFTVGGSFNADDALDFITTKTTPLIQVFNQENAKKIFKSPITKHCLIFTNPDADHHASTMSTIKTVANDFRGKTLFISVASDENQRVLDFFDLKETDLPKVILADMGGESGQMKKYPYSGELSTGALSSHFTSFLAGNVKPTLKSEPLLPSDTTGNVVTLKGDSFNDLVINNNKDVFVEFYAPWCGHCKKLAPVWEKLGEEFSSNDNIVIAQVDATANDVDAPGLSVKGFPSLYFFKGDNKAAPLKCEAGRELDDLTKYVKEHATHHVHEEL